VDGRRDRSAGRHLDRLQPHGFGRGSSAARPGGYREPAMQARINYAPTGDAHGDVPLSWSYQETVLSFNVFDELSTTEAAARAKIATLVAALGRLSYTVTITVDGATAEVWTCRPGSVVPVDDRTTFDLQSHRAVWTVTIPAYPIRS
jgi:hypothetical protein